MHTVEPLYVSDFKYINSPPSSFENAFPPSPHAHGLHLCYKSNLFALSFLHSQRGCIAIILVLLFLFQEGDCLREVIHLTYACFLVHSPRLPLLDVKTKGALIRAISSQLLGLPNLQDHRFFNLEWGHEGPLALPVFLQMTVVETNTQGGGLAPAHNCPVVLHCACA